MRAVSRRKNFLSHPQVWFFKLAERAKHLSSAWRSQRSPYQRSLLKLQRNGVAGIKLRNPEKFITAVTFIWHSASKLSLEAWRWQFVKICFPIGTKASHYDASNCLENILRADQAPDIQNSQNHDLFHVFVFALRVGFNDPLIIFDGNNLAFEKFWRLTW